MVKKGSIVIKRETNELYEVVDIIGTLLVGKPVNSPYIKNLTNNVPLKISEVDLLLDEGTDAFNILFGENEEN